MLLRVVLFLITNIAILIVVSFIINLLGLDYYLSSEGLDYTSMLVFCALFGMGGSFFSLLISKWMAKTSMGVHLITQPSNQEETWLLKQVEHMVQTAGIGMPEVGIFSSSQPNAFATGWNRNNALIAVSTGLLDSMTEDEIKAVLGHEIGHVANGDMITLSLIQGVLNTFVMFFARIVGHFAATLFKDESGHISYLAMIIVTIITEILFGILASIIVMWFSRKREFHADKDGAHLASKQGMIHALERLKQFQEHPSDMPSEMVAFGINGESKMAFIRLFMSHPPLEDRIQALKES